MSQYSIESDPEECPFSSNDRESRNKSFSIESDPEECSPNNSFNSVQCLISKRKGCIQALESPPHVKRCKLQNPSVAANAKPVELYGNGDQDQYYVKEAVSNSVLITDDFGGEEDGVGSQYNKDDCFYYWLDPGPDATDDEEEEVQLDNTKSEDKLEHSIESDPEECPSPSNDHVSQKRQTKLSVSIESDPEECPLSSNDPVSQKSQIKPSVSIESDPEECSTSSNSLVSTQCSVRKRKRYIQVVGSPPPMKRSKLEKSLTVTAPFQTEPDGDIGRNRNYVEEVVSNSVWFPVNFDGKEDEVESSYDEETGDQSSYYWSDPEATDDEDEVQSEWYRDI